MNAQAAVAQPRWRETVSRALHWSRKTPIDGAAVAIAAIGMALPILIGALTQHFDAGVVAGLGALAVGEGGRGHRLASDLVDVGAALAAALCAMAAGVALDALGTVGLLMMVPVLAVAAVIGGITRTLAVATTRFILFLVITAHPGAGASGAHGNPVVLFALGALWTALLAICLRATLRALRGVPRVDGIPDDAPPASFAHHVQRWRQSLRHFAAWVYPAQVTACLVAAQAIAFRWPQHHSYWVALTAMLVLQRQPIGVGVRALQRGAGTAVGAVLVGMLLAVHTPAELQLGVIVLIATLRPALKARNYFAYSVVMTPLIILLLDFGRAPGMAVVTDRVVASLAGCALAVVAELLIRRPTDHAVAAKPAN